MKTIKFIMIMGLLTLIFGCGKNEEDKIVSIETTQKEDTVVITCEMIQEKVDYILERGYKVEFVNKPWRGRAMYSYIVAGEGYEKYFERHLSNIKIYSNESNKSVYNYLNGRIEKIKEKDKWLKSQEPNPCLEDINFNGTKK